MKQRPFRGALLNEWLFGIYLFLVLAIDLFCYHFHWSEIANPIVPFLALLLLIPPLLFLGIPPLFRLLRGLRIKPPAPLTRCRRLLIWLLGFVIFSLFLLVWLAAYEWGQISPDSYKQLMQAKTGLYSDWHPVWHTLVFFTLPLKLFGSELSVFYFQLCVFCIIMGYCFLTLYEMAGLRFSLISLCAIALNPPLMEQLMFPWKDTAFAMAALLAAVMALRLWCLEKDWTHGRGAALFLGLVLANAALFRHNGILFSGFLLFALLFVQKKKNWIATALVFVLFLGAVRGPLYSALDVEKPGHRTLETMGLPLTVIGNVVTKRPELLDEETAEFAFSIAPLETWQRLYKCGNFNTFKFPMPDEDLNKIDEAGPAKILRMMGSCFRRAPLDALKGLFDLTKTVYAVSHTGDRGETSSPSVMYKDGTFTGLVREYTDIFSKTIFRPLSYIGTTLLFMLAAMLSRCSLFSKKDWTRILLCLSIFCYDFGTMLLLTGPDRRFFLASFLVCPVFVLLMFYEKNENTENTDKGMLT